MLTVSLAELSAAFGVAIEAIVPKTEDLRSSPWKYVPSARKNGRAVLPNKVRNFDMIWRDPKPDDLWLGGRGRSYNVRLGIAVSYPGIEPARRDFIIGQDAVDIYRALRKLIDPATPGLSNVTPLGERNAVESQASFVLEHSFDVSFHQAIV